MNLIIRRKSKSLFVISAAWLPTGWPFSPKEHICLKRVEIAPSGNTTKNTYQIPLVLVERVGGRLDGGEVELALETIGQWAITSLGSLVSGQLLDMGNLKILLSRTTFALFEEP